MDSGKSNIIKGMASANCAVASFSLSDFAYMWLDKDTVLHDVQGQPGRHLWRHQDTFEGDRQFYLAEAGRQVGFAFPPGNSLFGHVSEPPRL